MSVINLNNIEKSYGITEVLKGFSMYVNEGEKVGLIGANGSGKTTVFKIIAGLENYSAGSLAIKKDANAGYLRQMPGFNEENTIWEELKNIFRKLIETEAKIKKLEKEISKLASTQNNKSKLEKLMVEYSELQHFFELKGGYNYESKIRQVATGMGFSLDELQKKVKTLSGGEKTRLGLIRLLLTEPDLLLLDEPTNHLDLPAIQWLEEYLKDYSGAVIIISHDRYFLDEVVERVVEIKHGKDEVYHGNYSYYLKERKRRYEQQLKAYENQQKKIKKMEEAIKRLHQWGQQGDNEKLARRAKSMQKALDRIERIEKPVLDGKKMGLELGISKRSGREVLKVKKAGKFFGNRQLFKNASLELFWGEKAAVIGRNGTGKTTLIKMILGDIPYDMGEIKIGANVKIGYYSQEFEGFDPEDDLVTALKKEASMSTADARNALAAFLFTEEEVFKKVKDLSGGEKSRLRLLQLMNGDYNFLILDEPTNHLDLPSREVLEEALINYPGTILVVSHDRYFLNKLVDYIYELEDGTLIKYYGNYEYYRSKKEELKKQKEEDKNNKSKSKQISDYYRLKEKARKERKRKTRIDNIENQIEDKEEQLKKIEEEMVAPENVENYEYLHKLKEKYQEIKDELNELYQKWEELV